MVHAADLVPAVLFLVAYAAYFGLLVYLYATKAILWKSRYSFVFTHVVFRLVGMALGVAFASMEWQGEDGGERVNGACSPGAPKP